MKAPEEDRRTGGEAAGARIERFVAGDVLTLDWGNRPRRPG
jgi:hypothetical protein